MDPLPDSPDWRGINHMALVTPDMDATVRFYSGVLGMPLVATLMAGPMRHYFFEMAPGNTIAFFEVEGTETFAVNLSGAVHSDIADALGVATIPEDDTSLSISDGAAMCHLPFQTERFFRP